VLTLAAAVCWFAGTEWGILAACLLTVCYLASLWRHPWRTCAKCDGAKGNQGDVWKGTHGRCRVCDGNGRYPRWGVRFLTPGRARDLRNGILGRYG
jgi:hypothetical protein